MNRTIKFRAWEVNHKKMIDLHKLTPLATTIENHDGLYLPFVDNMILMQFTGLKDKNGKEIYEGDIVKFLYKNCIPEEIRTAKVSLHRIGDGGLYNNVSAYYPFVYTIAGSYKDKGRQTAECYLTPPSECEIIGNIYENPETLK